MSSDPLRPAPSLFTRDFIVATLANLFNSMGLQMLTATLPVYVLAIGGTSADAGLVAGLVSLTALVLRPAIGGLADAWSRRPLVLVGTGLFSLASLTYGLAANVSQIFLGRVLHGAGISCYTVAANAFIADIAPVSRRAEAIGFFAVAADIGLVTGPAVGFLVVGFLGFQALFWLSGGLALLALLISCFPRERRRRTSPWSIRTAFVSGDALPVAWMAFCLGMAFGPHFAFLSIFAQSRGVLNPGFYYTVQALALIASRTFAGRLADRRGRAAAIIPGLSATALGLALLPLWTDLPHFMISAALFGLGFGSAQPATLALLVDRVRPERRGVAVSTYYMGFDLGITLSSIGLGLVSQSLGFGPMWVVAGACALLGILGVFARRSTRPVEGTAAQPASPS